ncbi:MAG: M20/M25/M40 family metallo-hydrolase, partial [Candidatus Heimdallarchaeota archaeon]
MVEISREKLISLLKKLVSFKTVNRPAEGIKLGKECPEFIVQYLQERGIAAQLFEDEGYYSVFGKVGNGKFHLLLMAHFDVVPTGGGWATDPFELVIKDNLAFGRGVIDNKNNVASIMTILPLIRELN